MDTTKKKLQSFKIFYRISSLIIALAFLITGIGNLLPFHHIANDMAHLGYPYYFMKILGFWKILAGLTMLLPMPKKIRDFAYVGMMLDLTGAALSRLFIGDGFMTILIPLIISILVTLNFIVRNKNERY